MLKAYDGYESSGKSDMDFQFLILLIPEFLNI